MIEITTTDKDIIYLNFDYKGIPENLPIELIQIVDKPIKPIIEEEQIELQEVPELEREKEVIEAEKLQIVVPVKDVKEQLREIIV